MRIGGRSGTHPELAPRVLILPPAGCNQNAHRGQRVKTAVPQAFRCPPAAKAQQKSGARMQRTVTSGNPHFPGKTGFSRRDSVVQAVGTARPIRPALIEETANPDT